MDIRGFDEVSRVVGEVPGAMILSAAQISGRLAAEGADVRFLDVRAESPAQADEVLDRLEQEGLLHRGNLTAWDVTEPGSGPLLYRYGATTKRNIPEGTLPNLEEEIYFEDLRSQSSSGESSD